MTYKPKSTGKTGVLLSVMFAAASVMLFYSSSLITAYPAAYQIAAIISAITALEIYLKYVYSSYVYKADENDLKIFRITGNKSICVCSLNYEESKSQIVSFDYYLAHKSEFPKTKLSVNYCKNIFPKSYSLYFFNFNSKLSSLKFEPDSIFTEYTNKKIKAALLRKEQFENNNFDI